MSRADEMRRLLDERKVEYTQALAAEGTLFIVTINKKHYFILVRDNDEGLEIWSKYITPEQAIAATLGRGTCVPILNSERDCRPYLSLWFVCSECGCRLTENRLGKVWQKFCPNCSRKVIYE